MTNFCKSAPNSGAAIAVLRVKILQESAAQWLANLLLRHFANFALNQSDKHGRLSDPQVRTCARQNQIAPYESPYGLLWQPESPLNPQSPFGTAHPGSTGTSTAFLVLHRDDVHSNIH